MHSISPVFLSASVARCRLKVCIVQYSINRTTIQSIKQFLSGLNTVTGFVLPQCKSNIFKRSFINWCLFNPLTPTLTIWVQL